MRVKKGILLTNEFDLAVAPVLDGKGQIISGLIVGDSIDQDAVMVLKLRQGDLKEDALLGAGLTKFERSKYNKSLIEDRIRRHFARAGIDYVEYKERLKFIIN
jgi:hypothetical protein